MKAKLTRRTKWAIAALVVAALGVAALLLHAPVSGWLEGRRICEELRSQGGEEQFFNFKDTTSRPFGPQLKPGRYGVSVNSDCYSGECSFVVRDIPNPGINDLQYSDAKCRGRMLGLAYTGWYVDGFYAPKALSQRRIVVHVQRDGQTFWHGIPGQDCPNRGFCVEAETARQ